MPIHPYVSVNSRVRAGIERFGLVGQSQKSQGDGALKVDGGDEQRERASPFTDPTAPQRFSSKRVGDPLVRGGGTVSDGCGTRWDTDLSEGLCEHRVAVVSGGAYGIDGAAHRAALTTDGCTVAVLAGGPDVTYPAGHSALLHRIRTAGLLVSEYPPGIRPARHRFLVRNRLVAALSGANSPMNVAGVLTDVASQQVVGQMHGLPVVTDPNISTTSGSESPTGTEDIIYVVRASDIVLSESGMRARVLPETKAPNLTVLLQIYGYLAFSR